MQTGGELSNNGHLENAADLEIHFQAFANAVHELHGQQRVATKLEEVVVNTYALELKQLGEDLAEDLLLWCPRSPVGLDLPLRCGKGTTIDFSVGG